MIRLIKWLFLCLFLFGVLLGMVTMNSLADYSAVSPAAEFTDKGLKRVKRFIQINNPAKLKSGQIAHSEISQLDLNLLLQYLSLKAPSPLTNRVNSYVMLAPNEVYVKSSIRLPDNPLGKFINVEATLEIAELEGGARKKIILKSAQLGSMSVPGYILNPLAQYAHTALRNNFMEYQIVSESIKNIRVGNEALGVNYVWSRETAEQLRAQLSSRVIADELKQALIAQSKKLSGLSFKLGYKPSLNALIKPMFILARQRSQSHNPIIENKAVFITLGAYALSRNVSKIFDKKDHQPIKIQKIYLKRRADLSQHFLVSTAITSLSSSSLAKTIGIEKEVSDSQGGSGFSFVDLAADQAGVRLAEYSLESESQARKLQTKLSAIQLESDYMPSIKQLPEGITNSDFSKIYADKPIYTKLQLRIKQRIDQLAIYQQ